MYLWLQEFIVAGWRRFVGEIVIVVVGERRAIMHSKNCITEKLLVGAIIVGEVVN